MVFPQLRAAGIAMMGLAGVVVCAALAEPGAGSAPGSPGKKKPPAAQKPPAPTSRDTAGLGGRPGRWDLELVPTSGPSGLRTRAELGHTVELGRWVYRVERSPNARDGVPWTLHAEPIGPDKPKYHRQPEWSPHVNMLAIPVIKIPDTLWRGWFEPDLHDVVGIHYHEFVTSDLARVMITIHQVPPDGPDGKPPEDYSGVRGTRLEATLMTPVTFSLDQAIVVRSEKGKDDVVRERVAHEQGHAEQSFRSMLETLAGPQDADAYACKGRRSTIAWMWNVQKSPRTWEGYRDERSTMATLRTSITLVPPTRWTKLLPVPPEKLTAAEIQKFNDEVVHLDATFAEVDRRIQDAFHHDHGAFEQVRTK